MIQGRSSADPLFSKQGCKQGLNLGSNTRFKEKRCKFIFAYLKLRFKYIGIHKQPTQFITYYNSLLISESEIDGYYITVINSQVCSWKSDK